MLESIKRLFGWKNSEQDRYLQELRQEYEQVEAIRKHWLTHCFVVDPLGIGAVPVYYTNSENGHCIILDKLSNSINGLCAYNVVRRNYCVIPLLPVKELSPYFEGLCIEALSLAASHHKQVFHTLEEVEGYYRNLFKNDAPNTGIEYIITPLAGPLKEMAINYTKEHTYVRTFVSPYCDTPDKLIVLPHPEFIGVMPHRATEFGIGILNPNAVCQITHS